VRVDLDAAAIWLAIKSQKSMRQARDLGLSRDLFVGPGKRAWDFVESYVKEHGEIPGTGIVAQETGCSVHPPEEGDVTLSFVVDKMNSRSIFNALSYGLSRTGEMLKDGEQDDCVAELLKLSDFLRNRSARSVQLHTLAEIAPEVRQLYQNTKDGVMGLPFPWEAMNAMTMGLWPGTLTFFTARPGVGKTWLAIIIALHVWSTGKKVLVVSPEMSRVELGERLVSKYGRLPYVNMVEATLGDFAEKKLEETIQDLEKVANSFYILDDEDHLNPSSIDKAIEAIEPDLVVIDSVYMLKAAEGKIKSGPGSRGGRYDRILDTIDWMRSSSKRHKVPYLGISQLNRDGKVKKSEMKLVKEGRGTGGLQDTLAMSDTLLWDAHNLFAIWQDEDMRYDNQLMLVPLKVRRQARMSGLVINWDMQSMTFEQIGTRVPSKQGGGDYEDESLPY